MLTLEQAVAQSRDRVIFSLGYGRTPHGRVLSTSASLGEPGGDRLLAVGMTRARRSMVIVSAFRPDDIDEERQSHGVLALANILAQTEERAAADDDGEQAPRCSATSRRGSRKRGIRVSVGHRGRLALAAAHAGKAVVVETDEAFTGLSLRESLRLRPEVLRRLGWHYLRVHCFELFGDPEAVANRVAALLGKPEARPADAAAELMPEEPRQRVERAGGKARRARAHARTRIRPGARAAGGGPRAGAGRRRRSAGDRAPTTTASPGSDRRTGDPSVGGSQRLRRCACRPLTGSAPLRSASRSRIWESSISSVVGLVLVGGAGLALGRRAVLEVVHRQHEHEVHDRGDDREREDRAEHRADLRRRRSGRRGSGC